MDRAPEMPAAPRRMRRLPLWILLLVAVLAAGWTVVWTTARGRILEEIDRQLLRLADRGVAIVCADRVIGGFPFRMELSCTAPGVTLARDGVTASAAGLRVVAQVWDPRLVLVEIDGPGLSGDGRGGTIAATWRSLRMSLRLDGDGPQRLSIAAEGPDLTARPAGRPPIHYAASHLEAHGRRAENGHDLDLALSTAAASLTIADKRVGPASADLSATATLNGLLPPDPAAPVAAFAERGGRIEPVELTFAVGGVTVAGQGRLTLDPAGELDGMVTLVARGLESLATGGARDLGPELTTVLGGFALLGKPSNDPARPGRRLEMIVDHGSVRIGRVTLGRIPPIAAAVRAP